MEACPGEGAEDRSDEGAAVAHFFGMDHDAPGVLEDVKRGFDHLEWDGLSLRRPLCGDDDVLTLDAHDCVETPRGSVKLGPDEAVHEFARAGKIRYDPHSFRWSVERQGSLARRTV